MCCAVGQSLSMASSVAGFNVRNVYGGMKGGLWWWSGLFEVGVHGREDGLGGIAGSVHGGSNFFVGHGCEGCRDRITRDEVGKELSVVLLGRTWDGKKECM